MEKFIWLIPLLPLVGFVINGAGRTVLSKTLSSIISCAVVGAAFILSCMVYLDVRAPGFVPQTFHMFDFISAGSLQIPFNFYIDQLTTIWLLIITGVGFLILLYSVAYMEHESNEGFARFFCYMDLFIFMMLILVMGANYLVMFMGWEGVGLCSYLLIGFWYKNRDFTDAGVKAFVVNRVGDLGFIIGLFLIIRQFGSLTFTDVFPQAAQLPMGAGILTAITILLLVGACGKSAQIPLYTWLPDAMAGPTPISALIHAATMVTAGVYMIARSNILYTLAPVSETIVAIIGVVTAIFAASIAIKQYDIKKVLAYSTVSQIGYMLLGLGVGAFTGAVFHVLTHAFFKALLFLCAGSVMHALGGEQDMRKMGGLRKKMPVTYWTYLIACFAIAEIPPFPAFFSKGQILDQAFAAHPIYWVVGILGALLTAYYMFRSLGMTFHGQYRGPVEKKEHVHEGNAAMIIPLLILAVFAAGSGFFNIPEIFGGHMNLSEFLAPVFAKSHSIRALSHNSDTTEWVLAIVTSILMIAVMLISWIKFAKQKDYSKPYKGLYKVLEHKWYVDELYDFLISRPLLAISGWFNDCFEKLGIDGIVNGVGKTVQWGSRQVRLIQTGRVGFYLFGMVIGMVVLLIIAFFL